MLTRSLDRYRRVLNALLPRLLIWLGSLLSAFSLSTGRLYLGAGLCLLTLVGISWGQLASAKADRHLVARTLLLLSAWSAGPALVGLLPWLGLALLLGTLFVEPMLGRAGSPRLRARQLPGLHLSALVSLPAPLLWASSLSTAVLAIGAVLPGVGAQLIAPLISVVGWGWAVAQVAAARRHYSARQIQQAVADYAPTWALYYSGTSHGAYQIRMWLPYLERIGTPGMIVVRDRSYLASAAEEFKLPVLWSASVEALEYVMVPSLSAVFYVNNHQKNADGVRFSELTHVHLGHGDSDKPASYSATFGMFDRIFVAGEAAVERFAAHGVLIPREKFVLVGRPQVAELEVVERPAAPEQPVVLYAPTWRGGLTDSKFSSLKDGERIVRSLLSLGAVVWFRPHPYSARDAESRVLIRQIDELLASDSRANLGSAQTAAYSPLECMNSSDALVTDISSLASDYLYSNKPFAITDTGAVPDLPTSYPLTRAAVLLPLAAADLTPVLRGMLQTDPKREERRRLRSHYLGSWAPGEYAEVFAAAAKAVTVARA